MARKTIYCAQGFWPHRGRLKGGELHQFSTKERALEGGRAIATSAPGVAVFSVDGYPDVDLWDEPKMLETFGEVPAIDPAPPDEIQYFKIDCGEAGDIWRDIDSAIEPADRAA